MNKVDIDKLVPLDVFAKKYSIKIDLVYSKVDHPQNIFGKIYDVNALMWVNIDLAKIVLLASKIVKKYYGWDLVLCDGLRTVEAQEIMEDRAYVHPLLLSKAGGGAHPRGMAIDLIPVDAVNSYKIDMGTEFDYFAPDPDNPAARNYGGLSENIKNNRKILEQAMMKSANIFGIELLPLSVEWWDYRFPLEIFNKYLPLKEEDLYPEQKMINPDIDMTKKIRNGDFGKRLSYVIDEVLESVENMNGKY